ncbi:MAG: hypothetical protein Ct9H90mP3_6950 [Flammeovirgaceae bacterium]|nr:MAG: hypothetical protein Ct9H90mP3_6950 [Flammeovirgaceae bacterium]
MRRPPPIDKLGSFDAPPPYSFEASPTMFETSILLNVLSFLDPISTVLVSIFASKKTKSKL